MATERVTATWEEGLEHVRTVLDTPLMKDSQVTLGKLLFIAVLLLLLLLASKILKSVLGNRILGRSSMDVNTRTVISTLFQYVFIVVGFMIILQSTGIDLTTLTVIAGAVGVGIGLGLQEVFNNFVSGLIILFERPIKIGDRIEVDEVNGSVVEIRARSTTVLTNDNVAIIIPNSKFMTENVTNWTFNDRRIRFGVPVGVSYDSNPREVEKALLEAAGKVDAILAEPKPKVWFRQFGDSALLFELRAWTDEMVQNRGEFISQVNYAIHQSLMDHGIRIPFPQRDLHVKSGALRVIQISEDEDGAVDSPPPEPVSG